MRSVVRALFFRYVVQFLGMAKTIKRKVDNHMRALGDYDERTGIVRINKKASKAENAHRRKGNRHEVLDTLQHEKLHTEHPKWTEKKVYSKTPKTIHKMSKLQKHRLYGWVAK